MNKPLNAAEALIGLCGYAEIVPQRIIGDRDIDLDEILDDLPDDLAGELGTLVLHRNSELVLLDDKVLSPVIIR